MRHKLLILISVGVFAGILLAQAPARPADSLKTGKEIFEATCIGCHGPDGKGMRQASIGFEPPATFPDFSDCPTTTPEPNVDWRSIIHMGGPARGFSQIMPSFTEALRADQIELVLGYIRTLCTDKKWPRGEMNFPRAIATEKAFPEDETVATSGFNTRGLKGVSNQLVYERRFGPRDQLEVTVPFSFTHQPSGSWLGGFNDAVLGWKRVVTSNVNTGSILSVSGELIFPTGNRSRDLGTGVTYLETFAAFGQALPANSFLQLQSGFETPTRSGDGNNKALYWRAVYGKSLIQNHGFGRMWTPMVELLADREFATGEKINWDVMPEMQVTLSKRHHVRFAAGVQLPVNDWGARTPQVRFYVLWDWFDGGLLEGWK